MNKKLIFFLSLGFVIVAGAAFVGGRLLNGNGMGFGPLGMFAMPGGGGQFAVSMQIIPAPELPSAKSDLTGTFVERKDNVLTIQSFPMDGEEGGVAVFSVGSSADGGEPVTSSSADMSNGPKTEVVVTGKTIIYRDSTEMVPPGDQQNTTIQQTVEEGTLEDLTSNTMIQVWGRKNGDRIIADVIMYSTPVMVFRK